MFPSIFGCLILLAAIIGSVLLVVSAASSETGLDAPNASFGYWAVIVAMFITGSKLVGFL